MSGSGEDSNATFGSTGNLALLYYENPGGNVSALLQPSVWINSSTAGGLESQWLDITSQSSKSLPSEFHNVDPDVSHTFWEEATNNACCGGHRISTPFTSVNFSGGSTDALFYAPDSGLLVSYIYLIGLQGPGNFSWCMRSVSSHPEWFLAS